MITGMLWKKTDSINQYLTPSEYYEDCMALKRRGIGDNKISHLLEAYLSFTGMPIRAWSEPEAIQVKYQYENYYLEKKISQNTQWDTIKSMLITKTRTNYMMNYYESKTDAMADEKMDFVESLSYNLAQINVVHELVSDMMTERKVNNTTSFVYIPEKQKEFGMEYKLRMANVVDISLAQTLEVENGGSLTIRESGNGVLATFPPLMLQMILNSDALSQQYNKDETNDTMEMVLAIDLSLISPFVSHSMRNWSRNAKITWLTKDLTISGFFRKENALRYSVFNRILLSNLLGEWSGKRINRSHISGTIKLANLLAEQKFSLSSDYDRKTEEVHFKY